MTENSEDGVMLQLQVQNKLFVSFVILIVAARFPCCLEALLFRKPSLGGKQILDFFSQIF
jgi:hypothetical protein